MASFVKATLLETVKRFDLEVHPSVHLSTPLRFPFDPSIFEVPHGRCLPWFSNKDCQTCHLNSGGAANEWVPSVSPARQVVNEFSCSEKTACDPLVWRTSSPDQCGVSPCDFCCTSHEMMAAGGICPVSRAGWCMGGIFSCHGILKRAHLRCLWRINPSHTSQLSIAFSPWGLVVQSCLDESGDGWYLAKERDFTWGQRRTQPDNK